MDTIKEAVVNGVEKGLSKESQSAAAQVVRNLPDLAMEAAPNSTMKLLSNAMSGDLNSRALSKGLSEMTRGLDKRMTQQSKNVFSNQGFDGLADLTKRRRAVGSLGKELEEVAKKQDASLQDIQQAFKNNREGTQEIARLSANMGQQSPSVPSWTIPVLGGTGGALAGSLMQ